LSQLPGSGVTCVRIGRLGPVLPIADQSDTGCRVCIRERSEGNGEVGRSDGRGRKDFTMRVVRRRIYDEVLDRKLYIFCLATEIAK